MPTHHEMPTGRIEVKGQGAGELNDDLVARRAAEIASIEGRSEPNERDWAEAWEDLTTPRQQSPEESAGASLADIPAGSTPEELAVDRGQRANVPYEYEEDSALSSQLVEEGINEADHDLRVQSAAAEEEEESDLL